MEQAELRYAKRFDGVTGSAIRDIFKYMSLPGMISFAGGNPSDSALEDELISEIAHTVLRKHGKKLLQYGATEGWPGFREQTAYFLRTQLGIEVGENELLPTTGSTQAIDLLLKAMIDDGDVVLVEGPSFLGTLQALKLYGAKLVPVGMDDQGLIPDALEYAARKHRPKILYTVPTFQNPTGVTMSLERREAVLRLAGKYSFLIAEDDPYRQLRYSGEPLPPLFSLDDCARVVYLTSFSKLISPGLRVGAAVTRNQTLLRKLTVGKQSTDVHSASLSMAICTEYMERGLLPGHVEAIIPRYRAQLERILSGFQRFPAGSGHTRPDGGLFVWATLPEGMSALELLPRALEKRVAFVPGTYFYADGGHLNTLRLNFSNSEVDQIDEGMRRLAECMAI
ncbi:MAG: PLP-dependent aminotransferase family protein [Clostridia bacterium]|nr:PLP-dependent aminotransferase family protein [Clostridia bacterium]